jgi:hypothetical protein
MGRQSEVLKLTVDWGLAWRGPCGTGGGGSGKLLTSAAICAHDAVVVLPPLKVGYVQRGSAQSYRTLDSCNVSGVKINLMSYTCRKGDDR